MKHKLLRLLFIVPCLILCLIPSVGMIFHPTDEPIGNETVTDFPSLNTDDSGFNVDYLPQAGDWFEKHFAFRPQSVTLDAEIMATAFQTSNLDSVTVGNNDWLYYSSTLDDYLGRDTLSERQIRGVVHNMELTQEYVKGQGASFLFTVAPNKNTLYPENMPYYYSLPASDTHNRDLLRAQISNSRVDYCDLFSMFEEQDEVLYLKQDSHWNNKGALMAYDNMLDQLNKDHNDYSSAEVTRTKDSYGDLSKMLYPAARKSEFNYNYELNETYSYETPTKSVEDAIIKTVNPSAQGSLYMYRDSFGNALLPYFANAYGSAYFTKAYPVNLQVEMLVNKPDTVIIEIVERNLVWLIENPPVIPAPERVVSITGEGETLETSFTAELSEVNMQYIALKGSFDCDTLNRDDTVYLRVKAKDGTIHTYEAFDAPDGCLAYIPVSGFSGQPLEIDVVVKCGDDYNLVYHTSADSVDV